MDLQPIPQPEEQLPEEPKRSQALASSLLDTLEMFCWAFFLVVILFTVFFRFCRVDGSSMMKTLEDGQTLLISDVGYSPKTGDIVVFQYMGNHLEPFLIKRVIATEGQHLKIDFDEKEIYIDGVLYPDTHAFFLDKNGNEINRYTTLEYGGSAFYDPYTKTMELTIPENKIFVMGDNRNNSYDSRFSQVGLVDETHILGKVILRLMPFTLYINS